MIDLTTMNVSKDIFRLLIEEYFCLKTIYQCQFVSRFANKCIPLQKKRNAQYEKSASNMRTKQRKYFEDKRKERIASFVNEKVWLGNNNKRKALIKKYSKQEDDCFCEYCPFTGSPNEVFVHIRTHSAYHAQPQIKNCKKCNCINPNEMESPHFKEGCPLTYLK